MRKTALANSALALADPVDIGEFDDEVVDALEAISPRGNAVYLLQHAFSA
jgi:hypothetical protein